MVGVASILLRFAVACRPRARPVRRSGALVRARPPVATPAEAGGGGRGGAQRADPAGYPPGRGGGTSARPGGGRRAGAPAARRPGGEQGGIGGGGGTAPLLPAPLPCGVARGPRPCHPSSPACPPGVCTCSRGCRAAVGAERGLVGRWWVSVAGRGGGGRSPHPGPLPRLPQAGPRVGRFVCAFRGAAVPLPVGSG